MRRRAKLVGRLDAHGWQRRRRLHRGGGEDERHVGAARGRLLRERDAHAAARAVADVADGVDRLARAAGGDEHPRPAERAGGVEPPRDRGRDLIGLAHPAGADLALRQLAHGRPDHLGAACGEERDVRLRGERLPHAHVHRRRDHERAAEGERGLREERVGGAVGEAGEMVGRERRDAEELGVAGGVEVREDGVVAVGEHRPARQAGERDGAHEPRRRGGLDHLHVVAGAHEQPYELTALVGSDPATHADEEHRQ
jgi:hypothetical protein